MTATRAAFTAAGGAQPVGPVLSEDASSERVAGCSRVRSSGRPRSADGRRAGRIEAGRRRRQTGRLWWIVGWRCRGPPGASAGENRCL